MPEDMDGSAFGLGALDTEPTDGSEGMDSLEDEPQAGEPGTPPPAETLPEAPAPDDDREVPQPVVDEGEEDYPQAPAAQEEQTPAEAEAPQPGQEGYRWGGRFDDPVALDQAYRALQREYTTDHQERLAMGSKLAQMEMALQQLGPVLQQIATRQSEGDEDDPQVQLARFLDQAVNQRVQQAVEPLQRSQAAAQEQAAETAAIQAFASAHPELTPDGEEDLALATMTNVLQLDRSNPEALEIGLEAVRDPALAMVLRATPELVDSDEGMDYARVQARLLAPQMGLSAQAPGGPGTQMAGHPQSAQQTSQVTERRRQAATVERGSSRTPSQAPATANEKDEFDDAMEAHKGIGEGSAFFGSLK